MCVDLYKTNFCQGCKDRQDRIDVLKAANSHHALVEEVERLKEALKFYAEFNNYKRASKSDGSTIVGCDCGNIAKEALKESK